jgi:xanthine dehydrogenase accessory factor
VSPRRGGNRRIEIAFAEAAQSAPTAAPAEIFEVLLGAARQARGGVLATITAITGTGARAVGTHMAVLENGDSAGSFSSGCVEAAIVAEALEVLAEGRARTTRFGQGSPYIDIRLPCGGGMDVVFLPNPAIEVLEAASAFFAQREPFELSIHADGRLAIDATDEDGFRLRHIPRLKMILIGHGAEMLAALRLGLVHGAELEMLSPEQEIVAAASSAGVSATRLISPTGAAPIAADAWSAILFLFHDHDWEPELLARALDTDAFWIGAMGSERTQAARRAALAERGVEPVRIARIKGPVGLIPSSRDPATLALSALAEIVGAYKSAIS